MAEPESAGTVLVVEDESEILRFIVKVLAAQGYLILEAHDGAQALALCRQHQGPIHLLLTDVVIPDTSGPELIASSRPFARRSASCTFPPSTPTCSGRISA